MLFEAPAERLGWLNDLCAAAFVREEGDALVFEVHELLGAATEGSRALTVEPRTA